MALVPVFGKVVKWHFWHSFFVHGEHRVLHSSHISETKKSSIKYLILKARQNYNVVFSERFS